MKKSIIKVPKNFFEKKAWAKKKFVCGIDEVGRGCLAGPVVVAAVILPINCPGRFKDSKVLTAEEREKDYQWITQNAFWSTMLMSNTVIDQVNIYRATQLAMKKAYIQLLDVITFSFEDLHYLVVDAVPLVLENQYRHESFEFYCFPFGESISTTIAAASIVAKVTRDRLMTEMEKLFPAFSFSKHKGYGTKQHVKELEQYGPTLIHRKSFLKSFKMGNGENEFQQSLF